MFSVPHSMSSPGTPEALIEIDAEDWTWAEAFHEATEFSGGSPFHLVIPWCTPKMVTFMEDDRTDITSRSILRIRNFWTPSWIDLVRVPYGQRSLNLQKWTRPAAMEGWTVGPCPPSSGVENLGIPNTTRSHQDVFIRGHVCFHIEDRPFHPRFAGFGEC